MIKELAVTMFLGKPLLAWGGILTYLLLILTATISILNKRGVHFIPQKWHSRVAIATIIIATLHAIFAFSLLR